MSKAVSVLLMVLLAIAMPFVATAQCDVAAMHTGSATSLADNCTRPCCPAQGDTTPVNEQDGHTAVCALRCDALLPAVSEVAVAHLSLSTPMFGSFNVEPLLERERMSGLAVPDGRNGSSVRSSVSSPLRT